MIVWSCVAIYDGIVDSLPVFQYESDAHAWFRDHVDYHGGKEACEEGWSEAKRALIYIFAFGTHCFMKLDKEGTL